MLFLSTVEYIDQQQLRKDEQIFRSSRRTLATNTIQHDFINPPTTTFPSTNPVSNPVINPVTNPLTNPVTNPVINPVTNPVTNPVANPVTNPATTNPATNPATTNPATNPATTNPATNPATTNPATNPATTNPATNPATTNPATNPATTNPATNPVTNPATNPVTNPATNPATNPVTVTVPPDTSSTGIITVPAATPMTVIPTPATPVTNPAVPITNPVTTPTINNPAPVTTYPTTPTGGAPAVVVAPPVAAANAPAVPGQSWCVAKGGVPETSLQTALDYACGIGKADCSAIQLGASCYNPISLQNHASYAFNSYYQRNPTQTSCDFGGTALVTNVNPSSGSCIFTTWSSSTTPTTASPITMNPTPTPTTASSSGATPISFPGAPPAITNATNPVFGGPTIGFGETPPNLNTSISISTNLKPFIGYIIAVTSIINLGVVL
ncbi:hypothetical protein ABFS83_02G085100 [Erythranthe nasuta]